MEPYKVLDHEADAGFEVYGHTEEELFQNAVQALFSLITNLESVRIRTERRIEIPLSNESLVIFLNELLYLWDVERFIPKITSIVRQNTTIKVDIKGEIFNEEQHPLIGTAKAVTYHRFSTVKEKEGLKATFIVDI